MASTVSKVPAWSRYNRCKRERCRIDSPKLDCVKARGVGWIAHQPKFPGADHRRTAVAHLNEMHVQTSQTATKRQHLSDLVVTPDLATKSKSGCVRREQLQLLCWFSSSCVFRATQ
jgi:hypothetical protein